MCSKGRRCVGCAVVVSCFGLGLTLFSFLLGRSPRAVTRINYYKSSVHLVKSSVGKILQILTRQRKSRTKH